AVPVVGITSPHSHKDADGNPNAVAIDAGPRAVMGFAPVGGPAAGFALVRRVASDPGHFTLEPILLDVHLSIIVASPISIMVQDPQGRRIGFDSMAKAIVNEIGSTATLYTDVSGGVDWIDIGGVLPGRYTVTGVGTGTGPYKIRAIWQSGDGQ